MADVNDYRENLREWGERTGGRLFPAKKWKKCFDAPLASYPYDDFLPHQVPFVFTTTLPDGLPLYSSIVLENHCTDDTRLERMVLIGSVPESSTILYLFNQNTGSVICLDMHEPVPHFVNTSLCLFVEFLYRLSTMFYDGGDADLLDGLIDDLVQKDPDAFDSAKCWWSMVLE